MSTNLPALPNKAVAWMGEGLTAEQIRDRLTHLGNADPEAGHSAVDDLMRAVLEAIRDGHPDPQGLARAALVVDEADFSRWCA